MVRNSVFADVAVYNVGPDRTGMRREWRLLHRYALHMMHTEQGTQFNVGVVSQPITSSKWVPRVSGQSAHHFLQVSAWQEAQV